MQSAINARHCSQFEYVHGRGKGVSQRGEDGKEVNSRRWMEEEENDRAIIAVKTKAIIASLELTFDLFFVDSTVG